MFKKEKSVDSLVRIQVMAENRDKKTGRLKKGSSINTTAYGVESVEAMQLIEKALLSAGYRLSGIIREAG